MSYLLYDLRILSVFAGLSAFLTTHPWFNALELPHFVGSNDYRSRAKHRQAKGLT